MLSAKGRPGSIRTITQVARGLWRSRGGNAALMVALGMPALIGGAGFAVDTAQWYMWKRELQFAVDQAAIAGALARSSTDTEASYDSRARQEYAANVSAVAGIATRPADLKVGLVNYSGGVKNSVTVSATATRSLPFSSLLTGKAATIGVFAQASFKEGASFTSCLTAVSEDAEGAINIGGNSVLTAACGMAALSKSDRAITVSGNPTIDAGWILAAGGIDDWFRTNTDDIIMERLEGLYDPFKALSPPNPAETQVTRTYSCVKGKTTTRANVRTDLDTTYTYYKGFSPDTNGDGILTSAELAAATWQLQENAKGKSRETSSTTSSMVLVENNTVDGVTKTTTRTIIKTNSSTGANATWEMKTTVTTTTQSGTTATTTPDQATVLPGTYTDIHVGCTTVFAPGVYVIDGGGLKITGQYEVTGSGVMFVLKNGAWIDIAGGANINLTAITASQLTAKGVSESDANKLAGMLVFEDRNSPGSGKTKLNGNTNTLLNGTIYLPISAIDFAGTAGVSSQCLMIAANTIRLTGTANMTTFCPSGLNNTVNVVNLKASVKLVA
ncbi:pilus assembly protein [Tsuneonella sp. YG55]|uniref:Pilus assembly protein n=1 Tax=Tsuneonella litorea TaxID=2976475 RepID=A0A9X2VZ30_9SPHN|nr:TadE/TadG family type IV pilus assembly protein [Tsuneonella litorea]MCT2557997.1 pilus assembly protein [Tsuneonella litorea]